MYLRFRKGFTLLETLLAIVILGFIIAAIGIRYKHQTLQTETDVTAADLQAILQAAQVYYNNSPQQIWPNSINDLTGSQGAFQLNACGVFNSSLQNGSCNNRNSYTISFPNGYGSGNTSASQLPKAGVIYVSTTVPDAKVGQQLVAKLASANFDAATNTVTVAVPSPTISPKPQLASLMNEQKLIMVKSIYTDLVGKNHGKNLSSNLGKNNYNEVILPTCPNDWIPGYDVAFNQYLVHKGNSILKTTDNVLICKQKNTFTKDDENKPTYFTTMAKRTLTGDSWHAASVMVITYCMPPSVQIDANIKGKFSFIDRNIKKDANNCQYANWANTNGP